MNITRTLGAAAVIAAFVPHLHASERGGSMLFDRLAGAEVVYPDGHAITFKDGENIQRWKADGTTVLDTRTPLIGKRHGVWDVRHGQYCADFGPQDNRRPTTWTCWNVEFPAPGQITFVAPDGVWIAKRRVEGRFVSQ